MTNTRIIPGVSVTVVKEPLPLQLSPSGVLGLVGFVAAEQQTGTLRASSWSQLVELCGRTTAYCLPEARQAFDNGVSALVLAPVSGGKAASATIPILSAGRPVGSLTITARAPGTWGNQYAVKLASIPTVGDTPKCLELTVYRNGEVVEICRKIKISAEPSRNAGNPADNRWVVEQRSDIVLISLSIADWSPADLSFGDGSLTGGADATPGEYLAALERLKDEPDVDLVLAAVQDYSDGQAVQVIYDAVVNHCTALSRDCKGRIGLGQIGPGQSVADALVLASVLRSDRFVLTAPNGVVGAAAGMIGGLPYFESPTFKTVAGLANPAPRLSVDDQQRFLQGNVVPVVFERSRGVILLRGLTTDGDQLSVRRVADHAVRGMKMVGDLFIGKLNNADGRNALKQKLNEFLAQMAKDGALVPSVDGTDPAFTVNVYSSQSDFALGVVRVVMAVRPVRAIDYIYATILVQT